MRPLVLCSLFLPALPLVAQGNAVPGTDIRAYDLGSVTVYGRRGAAYPNGEIAMAIGHSMCNAGSVHLPWLGWASGSGSVMLDTYPKIAFLIAREANGRMQQISGKSNLKHSRVAFNFSSGPCAPCQSGPSATFRVGCSDTYSTGFNGSQGNLGPTDEIDPWLGSWNPVGSYFDRGDPAVGGAAASDGIQSLTTSGFDAFKNRVQVREQDLVGPGTIHGQIHLMIKGEPGGNRANNLVSRPLSITWTGSSWSSALAGTAVQGSVLERWTGATTALGGNGADDGRFLVAVKVTGPTGGRWHYEYAVHNLDNGRGGASLRIPICPTARVWNAGSRDIDGNPLNDWTAAVGGGEIAFLAGADNPLDWNCIYNFWFDSDAAPVGGSVAIDQARLGAGALTVAVGAQVPGLLGSEHLGAGCGAPAPVLWANGVPASPNPAFAVQLQAPPASPVLFLVSAPFAEVPLGGGCSVFVDPALPVLLHLATADAGGVATWGLPVPAGLSPVDYHVQAFAAVAGGPLFGSLAASNGLRLRAAGTGCP